MTQNHRTIRVEGMHCEGCQARVQDALEGVPGVAEAAVSLEDDNARVALEEDVLEATLREAIVDAGFEAPTA